MGKVSAAKVVTGVEAIESPLPARIQEVLGELVGAAGEGLLALSVGVGLGVVQELIELEVDEVVRPKGRHNADRGALRHGHQDGSMTLGGRRVGVRRPRLRTADGEHELVLKRGRVTREPGPWAGNEHPAQARVSAALAPPQPPPSAQAAPAPLRRGG